MANQGDRFRRRALSRGYKVDEVDAFLDRVEATLSGEPMGTPVPSQEVDDVVFRVRFGGYDEWQVDVYLDRVARQLGELEERGVLGRAPAPEYASGPIGESPQRDSMSDEYEAMPRETAMMTRQEPSPPRDREMGFPPREPSPPRDREMGFPPREPSPPRDR
ncbi:MAG TPA: DivIVA domain-containing protein, partial [Candidatus Stackebrandtia faecavium]|nr:DivIVA domain-containing protein [Candidatus Stackebrandtia faecavium]